MSRHTGEATMSLSVPIVVPRQEFRVSRHLYALAVGLLVLAIGSGWLGVRLVWMSLLFIATVLVVLACGVLWRGWGRTVMDSAGFTTRGHLVPWREVRELREIRSWP